MGLTDRRKQALALLGVSLAIMAALAPLLAAIPSPTQAAPGSGIAATPVFSFGASADFGGIGEANMIALAKRATAGGESFLLALGDLGYTSDEAGWCRSIKGAFNDVLVIAGNHDTSESGPGDMAQYVIYCPFTLSVPVTAGAGTPGYGYEYYFDYPATNPLVRVLMISPGVGGALNYNFGVGSSHYNWVVDSVNDARSRGIPWVVAGSHKQCINVGTKSCDMGQTIFDKLVDLKVDLILTAHDHSYHRSHQLALGPNCPSVVSVGNFDADCVVDDGSDDFYNRGFGSVKMIVGTGGRSVRTVTLSGSDREIGYFAEVMGSNANTQGKSWGYGYTRFEVSAESVTVRTDFCPPGTTGSDGQCLSQQTTVFKDQFQIGGTPPPPPPLAADFAFSPTNPNAGDTVTFTSLVSGGTSPYGYAWTFGDGTSASVTNPTHIYGSAGTFTVTLGVTDAVPATVTASKSITVSTPPPLIGIPVNAFRGLYYDNEDLSNMRVQRIDNSINFNWGSGTPDPSIGADTFSVRWEGYWDYGQAGIYRFTVTTDDGMRASVDNVTTVLDAWIPQSPTTYTQDVEVAAGRHYVRVEFFERTAGAVAQVSWSFLSPPPQPRPTARIALTPGYPKPGDTVTFDASSSTSLNGTLEARWDWQDDGAWDTAWSATLTAQHAFATEGAYTVRLEVRDAGGLTDNATQAVAVDGTAPTTSASLSGTSGSAGWYRSAVAVTLSGTDPLSGVASTTYRVDGGSWLTYGTPVSVAADGSHTLEFASTDRAGNAEAPKSVTFQVDATAPSTTRALAGTLGSGNYYVSDVTVTLTASDTTSGVASTQYRLDGGSWLTYATSFVVSGNGSHLVEYRSTDAAGNAEATQSAPIQIGPVASSPPASTLSLAGTQGTGTWYVSAVAVTLAATDPGSFAVTIKYRLDGGSWLTYATPFQVVQGRHTVEYYATNAVGLQETPKAIAVDIDVTPPAVSTSLSGPPSASGWFKPPVDVTVVASDALSGVATVEYRVDAGAWTTYTAPVAVGEGRHIVEFRATDAAGLASSAGLVAIDVDGTPPVLEGLAPSGFVTTNRVMISWQGHDTASGLVGYEVSLDGGPFASLGMVTNLWADFDEGGHNVLVKAVDAAGNEAVAVVSFRVDTNAFSPTGPYSGIPMFLILELVVAAVTMAIMRRRHKRRMALYG